MSRGIWGIPKRVGSLRTEYLPKLDAYWRGTPEEFTEFLIRTIDQMPEQVRVAMKRYYLLGETQRLNPLTGRPEREDGRYRALLSQGRGILATLIRVANNDQRPMKLLEKVYVNV